LTENFEFIGDKGYKGCKYVKVCEDKQEKSKRQIIEAMNSQIKNFNLISRWRERLRLLLLIYMHILLVIAFLEKVNYGGNFSLRV
jgi:hypothetical protein